MQIVTICQVKQQLSLLCLFALWLISCTGYHSGRTGVPVPDSSGIASHSDPAVKRYGMVTGLRTDKVAYYEQ
ncbi:MAG: hypothetical protein Q8939_06735, partial [Bacteroidota bacterium]|nr:hypothetical protein [Bacteroidota bacterium]